LAYWKGCGKYVEDKKECEMTFDDYKQAGAKKSSKKGMGK